MFENKNKLTEISSLGEFGLINRISDKIKIKHESTIKGIGDDAAVLDYKDKQMVVTTDMLIEGVHFSLMYSPLKHLGYKSVVVNVSDVYAMNATPKQITVSLAISNRLSVEAIDELYEGIKLACDIYDVDLIGGDTTSSKSGLCISITALGEVNKEDIVYRNTANNTDLICVSGDLGAAYMGLQLLERENEIFKDNPQVQPDLDGHDYILERQLKPEARGDIIKLLKDNSIKPTAMMDISDGLSSELLHITEDSGLGCTIYEEKIPIDLTTHNMAAEFNIASTVAALNGGEDYELLFTIPVGDFDKIVTMQGISVIGHMNTKEEGNKMLSRDGKAFPITAQGWNALKNKSED